MKYSKYIAVGIGIAIFSSSNYITYGWFTSQSNVQTNTIRLHNPPDTEQGEGFYTRKVDKVSDSKFKFRFKALWSDVGDTNGNLIWNEDGRGDKYLVEILNYNTSGAFAGADISYDPNTNKKDNFITVSLPSNINWDNVPEKFGSYYITMKVGVGANNKVEEYLEVGIRIKKKDSIFPRLRQLEAQWDIISRTPVDNIQEENKDEVDIPQEEVVPEVPNEELAPPSDGEQTPPKEPVIEETPEGDPDTIPPDKEEQTPPKEPGVEETPELKPEEVPPNNSEENTSQSPGIKPEESPSIEPEGGVVNLHL